MATDTTAPIGPRVRARIELAGRTVADIARAINQPPTTLVRKLNTDELPMSQLRAISAELNVPVSSWFEVNS